jgi:Tol biopolymer transport system component
MHRLCPILTCCILAFLLAGCVTAVPIAPPPTVSPLPPTSAPTLTATATALPATATPTQTPMPEPSPAATATPTLRPYDYAQLPGWFAFMDFDCRGLCTNVTIIRPDLSERRQLTDHDHGLVGDIYWAPGGGFLAFTFFTLGDNGQPELRLVDAAGKTETVLAGFPLSVSPQEVAWSPDEKWLVFTALDGEKKTSQLMRLNLSSHAVTDLSRDGRFIDESAAWAPDGKSIVFASNRPGGQPDQRQLWVMDADGANPRPLQPLTKSADRQAFLPSWSPDGKQVAYLLAGSLPGEQASGPTAAGLAGATLKPTLARSQSAGETNGLWVIDLEGGAPRHLAECASPAAQQPKWSPDGAKLVLICGQEGQADLLVVDAEKGGGLIISKQPGNYYAVSWSPDSGAFIYMEGADQTARKIHLVVFIDGQVFQVDSDTPIQNPAWSPVAELP